MTTNGTTPPDPSYTTGPGYNGYIYETDGATPRWRVELWYNPTTQHSMTVASPTAKQYAQTHGFSLLQPLGYVEPASGGQVCARQSLSLGMDVSVFTARHTLSIDMVW